APHAVVRTGVRGHVRERGMEHVEHELAAWREVAAAGLEARDLIRRRQVVEERAERHDDERELAAEIEVAHVRALGADASRELLAVDLRGERREHLLRAIDADDGDAAPRDRERDATGPDPDLEHGSAGCAREARVERNVGLVRGEDEVVPGRQVPGRRRLGRGSTARGHGRATYLLGRTQTMA